MRLESSRDDIVDQGVVDPHRYHVESGDVYELELEVDAHVPRGERETDLVSAQWIIA